MPTLRLSNITFKMISGSVLLAMLLWNAAGWSQTEPATAPPSLADPDNKIEAVPAQVDVVPIAEDKDIAARLTRILKATGWYTDAQARVDEGVVFLSGKVDTAAHQEWASKLAGNTQDVVAVVNQMTIPERALVELGPAWEELRMMGRETIHYSPLILVAFTIVVLSWLFSSWSAVGSRALLKRRWKNVLLRDVVSRAIAIPVFLLGLYIALKVSGLTRLAVTVLGGTGLIGLVLGFAFRDIAENFLASILISVQHPFATGDLIEVAGYEGFVQSVNTRATVLTTLEGNRVQIPNATIYKQPIVNKTANPNIRCEFKIGIGYDDSISHAQTVALKVMQTHIAVLKDPEPLVLVESLGTSTINMQIFFWVNNQLHNNLKVKSAIIRLTKAAFTAEGITLPDEAREIIFPQGVPVRMLEAGPAAGTGRVADGVGLLPLQTPPTTAAATATVAAEAESASHEAEGALTSDNQKIIEQGEQGRKEKGELNLLEGD